MRHGSRAPATQRYHPLRIRRHHFTDAWKKSRTYTDSFNLTLWKEVQMYGQVKTITVVFSYPA